MTGSRQDSPDALERRVRELVEPGGARLGLTRELGVVERHADGRAEFAFELPHPRRVLQLDLERQHASFGFFSACGKSVDGAFLVEGAAAWDLYLVECKRSVKGLGRWRAIKEQFRASVIKCRAVAGVLELPLGGCLLITAFEEEELSLARSRVPLLKRRPASLRAAEEWEGAIAFRGLGAIAHHPQPLVWAEGQGSGRFPLPPILTP